ncbi:tetratricopeptide repeat protein [Aquimarina aquimarini]|uniref:tetratricopeptide repeat protein n=1 Tax=Aquimarina aquimarini TaxID=1191734 RepID=UPI000D550B44|nr:tetratricopeptide repeat protein [Aquimarina aquimarini]
MKSPLAFLYSSFWIIFFITLPFTTYAQIANDTVVASQYYKKADSLLTEGEYDPSIGYFTKAIPIYNKAKAWKQLANSYNKISENQRYLGSYQESLSNAKKALEIVTTYSLADSRQEAAALDNIGEYYFKKRKIDQALFHFKKSVSIRKKILPSNHSDISKSYNSIGRVMTMKNKFNEALKFYNKAIDPNFKDNIHLPNIYSNMAGVYFFLGKYNKAIIYMQNALQLQIKQLGDNHPKNVMYYNNIGILFEKLEKYDKVIFNYIKALEIQKKIAGENHSNIAVIYTNMANVFFEKRDFDKAIEYNQKAIEIRSKTLGDNHPKKVLNYFNVGRGYLNKGMYNKALSCYKKGIELQDKKKKGYNPQIAVAYTNLALIYLAKKEYKKALTLANKVLQTLISTFGEKHPDVATAYAKVGDIYRDQQKWEKALFYYNKTINIRFKIFGENHKFIADTYLAISDLYKQKKEFDRTIEYSQKALDIYKSINNKSIIRAYNCIASIYVEKKEYDKALVHYHKAIKENSRVNIHSFGQNKSKNQTDTSLNPKILLTSIRGQSKSYMELFKQHKDKRYLKKAIKGYQKSDSLINTLRQSFTNYQDKVDFAKTAKAVYKGAIEVQLLQNDQSSIEQAFYYAEKSKANTLKELLNDANAKSFTGLPEDLISLEKEIRINYSFYQSKIVEQQSKKELDTTKLTYFEGKLFDVSKKQDSLIQVLETKYPKYYQLKYKNETTNLSTIQKQLDNHTTLLEFFTTDRVTYAFTISKTAIAVQQLATPQLTEKIQTLGAAITSRNTTAFKQKSNALYTQLIAPIADKLVGDQLIIIPDGVLWHLNFELLLTQKDENNNNPALLSYLLRDYAITYANAANLLFDSSTRNKQKTLQECLAFSFSDSTQTTDTRAVSLATLRATGDDLPGTRREIRAISEIIDGQYYYGSQAIEANFKKNAGQYNILHLALHGEVDNEHPENSRLYFTKDKDTIEDNYLYSHELFAMDIPAELTVLSACNTGTGKIATGEGIMSLGTAFQYAGTKSLLLTGWEVSDQTTPELMQYFYKNLKSGMSKGKALQQAKLEYLATANINRTAPFYWAGFYLVGDTAPIAFTDNTRLYWILGIVGLIILSAGLFWYRKKGYKN